tara:strand:- start:789 stop:1124 length:336 start_codon:yes stop_codon:yes gene_type:complete
MTEEEPLSPQPPPPDDTPTDHLRLRRVYQLASIVGDWPGREIDPTTWHQWFPEPECERKDRAWRRLEKEGRYEHFLEAKKYYKAVLVNAGIPGSLLDDVFYMALRHFPPGA